jgi:very-short-patch-repair endonuclease
MTSLPPQLHILGPLLFGAAVVAIAVGAVFRRDRKPWLTRIQRKPLMTENEKEFFQRLQRALPRRHVFPQVSFAAFLTDDGKLTQQKRWSVRSRFARKIADFVVCDRETLDIVALVELDDRTHSRTADSRRDELTEAAGYQTFRFQSKQKPTEAEIASLFSRLGTSARKPSAEYKPRPRATVTQ